MPRLLHGWMQFRAGCRSVCRRAGGSLLLLRGRFFLAGWRSVGRAGDRLLHFLHPVHHACIHVLQGLARQLLHLQRLDGGLERRDILFQPEQHRFQFLDTPARFLGIQRGRNPLRKCQTRLLRLPGLLQKTESRHEPGKIKSCGVDAHVGVLLKTLSMHGDRITPVRTVAQTRRFRCERNAPAAPCAGSGRQPRQPSFPSPPPHNAGLPSGYG